MTNSVASTLTERGTDVVAVTAVSSPVWLPALQQTSEVFTLLLPIAGVAWLGVQIYVHIARFRRGKK